MPCGQPSLIWPGGQIWDGCLYGVIKNYKMTVEYMLLIFLYLKSNKFLSTVLRPASSSFWYNHGSKLITRFYLAPRGGVRERIASAYGVGFTRGKKTAAGRLHGGRATPETAERPFQGWPARRA
jgi:hypothetical protein